MTTTNPLAVLRKAQDAFFLHSVRDEVGLAIKQVEELIDAGNFMVSNPEQRLTTGAKNRWLRAISPFALECSHDDP